MDDTLKKATRNFFQADHIFQNLDQAEGREEIGEERKTIALINYKKLSGLTTSKAVLLLKKKKIFIN